MKGAVLSDVFTKELETRKSEADRPSEAFRLGKKRLRFSGGPRFFRGEGVLVMV